MTAALGALNGRLREVHLAAHIVMRDALTPEQRADYALLRGYTSGRLYQLSSDIRFPSPRLFPLHYETGSETVSHPLVFLPTG